MPWPLSDLRSEVLYLLAEVTTSNDMLMPGAAYTLIDNALNEGLEDWYRSAGIARRSHTYKVVDLQATYTDPLDMYEITDILFDDDEEPLAITSKVALTAYLATWRFTDASTEGPTDWYREDARRFSLYPAPDITGTVTMTLEGKIVPYGVGKVTTVLSRTGTTVTVTTSAAHGLIAGDLITISNASNSAFDGNWTAATIPSTTTFTYTHTSSGTLAGTTGIVTYRNGVAPLYATTDVPLLQAQFQRAPALLAAWRLSGRLGHADKDVRSLGLQFLAEYREMLSKQICWLAPEEA